MQKLLVSASTDEFLGLVDRTKRRFFVVCGDNGEYLGVVTEGDFRRFVLNNNKLPAHVSEFYNPEGYFEYAEKQSAIDGSLFDFTKGSVPLVDRNKNYVGLKSRFKGKQENGINSVACVAPVRVSFAGGGSDLEYWWSENRGRVVNLAIDKFTRIRVTKNNTDIVNVWSLNLQCHLSCKISELSNQLNHKLFFVVKCLLGIGIYEGYDIEIFCDFEPCSGLGGSSSLVVCFVKAFSVLYQIDLSDYDIIRLSYNLERNHAGVEGGWQDFIPAVCGGLNVINFDGEGFKNYNLSVSPDAKKYFNNCLFLSPVGQSRSSSQIHSEQKMKASELSYQEKMSRIVDIADQCVDLIGMHHWDKLGDILHKGWLLKRSLGEFISSQLIDDSYQMFLDYGATGGRLLGAGGSGFLLLHVPIWNQATFLQKCHDSSIKIDRVKTSIHGVRSMIND